MKNIFTIMKFTIKEYLSKKIFIVVNIIMILLIILACNIPNIINSFDTEEEIEIQKIVIIDEENILSDYLKTLNYTETGFEISVNPDSTKDEIKKRVENEEIYAMLELSQDDEGLKIETLTKEDNMFSESNEETFVNLIKSVQVTKELVESNISQESINNINSKIKYEERHLENANDNSPIAMIASFILFFAVYFYGYTVSSSVSSEKTSRVMETLVTSTTPTSIILGKTFAMGLIGLVQILILGITAVISYNVFIPDNFDFLNQMLSNVNLSLSAVLICLLYFILGYIVYAFLNAVTGATVSKAEDIQSANTPIALISVGSFYLAYFTSMIPNSPASKFASFFPFSSAFSMPGRIFAGGVGINDIILSIVILLATAIVLAYISIKVYSAAILHYGDRLKLKDLPKLFKQK